MTEKNVETVQRTLDALALALAETGRVWTPAERRDYEKATRILRAVAARTREEVR